MAEGLKAHQEGQEGQDACSPHCAEMAIYGHL